MKCYCPSCDRYRLVDLMMAGNEAVQTCATCDNVQIYRDREQFIQRQIDVLNRIQSCDHDFRYMPPSGTREGICNYCGLHRGNDAMDHVHSAVTDEVKARA